MPADEYVVVGGGITACAPADKARILGLPGAREATFEEIAEYRPHLVLHGTPLPAERVVEASSETPVETNNPPTGS